MFRSPAADRTLGNLYQVKEPVDNTVVQDMEFLRGKIVTSLSLMVMAYDKMQHQAFGTDADALSVEEQGLKVLLPIMEEYELL